MTKEWYLKRINNLDVNSIKNLDSKDLARLTCGFNTLFVGKLILRGSNIDQQRTILQHINNKYVTWKRETRPKNEPAFYQKLYDNVGLSIKCGMMIRPEELDKFISDAENNTITDVKKSETTDDPEENIEELPATQKVRMELALLLLKKAGLTDEVLNQQKNKLKVATIMATLLDIHSNNKRGNDAQTCSTYISARDLSRDRHKLTIENINSILKELNIDIQI